MELTQQQLAYLRRVYRLCGARAGACADSRAVATAIGATEDERMDIEDALAQPGYIVVGSSLEPLALPSLGGERFIRCFVSDHQSPPTEQPSSLNIQRCPS